MLELYERDNAMLAPSGESSTDRALKLLRSAGVCAGCGAALSVNTVGRTLHGEKRGGRGPTEFSWRCGRCSGSTTTRSRTAPRTADSRHARQRLAEREVNEGQQARHASRVQRLEAAEEWLGGGWRWEGWK